MGGLEGKTYTTELGFEKKLPLVDGLLPTDGVQYSAIATFGTTAVEIFNKRIDPGFTAGLQELYVGLTQMFTGLNGSFVASINYYWRARPVYTRTWGSGAPYTVTGAYVPITGTYQKAVGTITTSEDTFSGYIPVASLPFAPLDLSLMAVGIQATVCQGKVKNSSIVTMTGVVIPGT